MSKKNYIVFCIVTAIIILIWFMVATSRSGNSNLDSIGNDNVASTNQKVVPSGFPKSTFETEANEHILKFSYPGLDKTNVSIVAKGSILTINAEVTQTESVLDRDKKNSIYRNEKAAFSKSFTIPEDVNKTKMKATCKDGTLTVVLPFK